MNETDAAYLSKLRNETLSALGEAIGTATDVALVDAPQSDQCR